MNTPSQQAELYRKAAETIEMCAKHGIEPEIKHYGCRSPLLGWDFSRSIDAYEFPLAVIECQLVWADTVAYRISDGLKVTIKSKDYATSYAGYDMQILGNWDSLTLTPPKRTVMVELLVEDAEWIADVWGGIVNCSTKRIEKATKEALDNLKA